MGRKPNPVISTNFTRGAKIGDASNRYQYTCKQCGERFSRGRIESLYNHVTKACTASSPQEKRDHVLQIHELGLAAAAAAAAAKGKENANKRKKSGKAFSSPPLQVFNGLNVLAEASSQVVETQNSYAHPLSSGNGVDTRSMVLDPASENKTLPSGYVHSAEDAGSGGESGELSPKPPVNSRLTLAGISPSSCSSDAAIPLAHNVLRHSAGTSTTTAPYANVLISSTATDTQAASLTSIAASASATLAHSLLPKLPIPVQEHRNLSAGYPIAPSTTQNAYRWLPVATAVQEACDVVPDDNLVEQQRGAALPRPVAVGPRSHASDLPLESSQESDHGSLTQKPKARAGFSEARKQEITKMRRLRSCIRCRMLRKPCSVETPCATCGVIDSPRVWKGFPCLHAKLVDLYQGYMLGLFQILSCRDINAIKAAMRSIPKCGNLVVKYFEVARPLVLGALEIVTNNPQIDPPLSMLSNGRIMGTRTVFLNTEANDLPTILEEYFRKEVATFLEQEQSPVMKSIGKLAYQYSQESKDVLLQNVVELWMLTTMLSDPRTSWRTWAFQSVPQSKFCDGQAEVGLRFDVRKDEQSYPLICCQLQSGLERLAKRLSTHAMSKFEQRLSRPASINHFETFLMAVLLINCFERHSLIFHSWTDASKAVEWPLDQSLPDLILQVEQVTNVITSMIKVRNLTPEITEDTPGSVLKAKDTNDEKCAQLFEEVGVTVDFLTKRQSALFDTADCRSLDLKYSATLLIPTQECGGT